MKSIAYSRGRLMADSLGKTGYLCDSQDTRKEFGI